MKGNCANRAGEILPTWCDVPRFREMDEAVLSVIYAFWAAKSRFPAKKHLEREMLGLTGGGGGIRTHETLLGPNGFQDRRFQPLTHPSD